VGAVLAGGKGERYGPVSDKGLLFVSWRRMLCSVGLVCGQVNCMCLLSMPIEILNVMSTFGFE